MTNKEMTYLLKNKIYAVFTNTYLLNENKDPKLDYLKVRNILLKLLDKDTYDYSIKDFTYYYDFNNPIILEENNNNQEISDNDIIRGSIFLIKSVINELIIHTTYYPRKPNDRKIARTKKTRNENISKSYLKLVHISSFFDIIT